MCATGHAAATAGGRRVTVVAARSGGSGLGAMHGMRAKMELDVRIGRGIGLPSLLQPRLNHSKLMELGTGGHIQKFTWASAHVGKGYLIYFGLD
jgi:hypothetical protein